MTLALALAHAERTTSPHDPFTETCLWETPHGTECGRPITDDAPFFCHRHDPETAEYADQHAHQLQRAIDNGHDYLS